MEPKARTHYPLNPEENYNLHGNQPSTQTQSRATVRTAADTAQAGQQVLNQPHPLPTGSASTLFFSQNQIPTAGSFGTRSMPRTSVPSSLSNPPQYPSAAATSTPSVTGRQNRAIPRTPGPSIFSSDIPFTSAKPPKTPKYGFQNHAMPRTSDSPSISVSNSIPQPIPMALPSFFESSHALPRGTETPFFSTFLPEQPQTARPGQDMPRPKSLPSSGSNGNNYQYNNRNNSNSRRWRHNPSSSYTPLHYKIMSIVTGFLTSIALLNLKVPMAAAIGIGLVVTVLMRAISPKRPVRQIYL